MMFSEDFFGQLIIHVCFTGVQDENGHNMGPSEKKETLTVSLNTKNHPEPPEKRHFSILFLLQSSKCGECGQILQQRCWNCVCDQFKSLTKAADWITGCKQSEVEGTDHRGRAERELFQTGHDRKSPQ